MRDSSVARADLASADAACFHVLIPCAGNGSRAGGAVPKQYQPLAGRMVVEHTLAAFLALAQRSGVPRLGQLALVVAPDADAELRHALGRIDARVQVWPVGGAVRAASVLQGLLELERRGAAAKDWVLVHDAARCLIEPELTERLLAACWHDAVGGLLALPLPDTLKSAAPASVAQTPASATSADLPTAAPATAPARVAATLERSDKWLAQTPQMFRLGHLRAALTAHQGSGFAGITDEASAMERSGAQPLLVPGSARNFKLTHPHDFALAQAMLLASAEAPGASSADPSAAPSTAPHPAPAGQQPTGPELRIGEGWDVHQLVAGRPLILGGVAIPHAKGLLGHSDADALLHAITDALLGAAALGDIGTLFPDTDTRFAGADSAVLLAHAAQRVAQQGWVLRNVDSTIVAQEPKMAPYKAAMQARIAAVLGLQTGQVNVKAKTAERLGPVGEGRAIECRAVVLLQRG